MPIRSLASHPFGKQIHKNRHRQYNAPQQSKNKSLTPGPISTETSPLRSSARFHVSGSLIAPLPFEATTSNLRKNRNRDSIRKRLLWTSATTVEIGKWRRTFAEHEFADGFQKLRPRTSHPTFGRNRIATKQIKTEFPIGIDSFLISLPTHSGASTFVHAGMPPRTANLSEGWNRFYNHERQVRHRTTKSATSELRRNGIIPAGDHLQWPDTIRNSAIKLLRVLQPRIGKNGGRFRESRFLNIDDKLPFTNARCSPGFTERSKRYPLKQ